MLSEKPWSRQSTIPIRILVITFIVSIGILLSRTSNSNLYDNINRNLKTDIEIKTAPKSILGK